MHVHLFHWKPEVAEERTARLHDAGYEVACTTTSGTGLLKELRKNPPAAVVIDLSRLPSHGKEVGRALRESISTRNIPLVFVEGQAEKVEPIKRLLPDAVYTTWDRIAASLKRAISRPPKKPVVPPTYMAGYSGTPLPKKLGFKESSIVCLINAPEAFERTLGALPQGVRLAQGLRGKCDLIVWFVEALSQLETRIAAIAKKTPKGGMWICWPKQASGVQTDVSESHVRRIGMASGLVDYKICAVDATWSGLKFARRKA